MNMNIQIGNYLYATPEGFSNLVLSAQEGVLTGVSFVKDEGLAGVAEGDSLKASEATVVEEGVDSLKASEAIVVEEGVDSMKTSEAIRLAVKWLDIYFAGGRPDFLPPYRLVDVTPFRQQVMDLLLAVPYGRTVTYGELAKGLAEKNGRGRMSAQAVGQAVGWNPIGIMIPCHRVLGSDGRLTGYAGGMTNKQALLRLENSQTAKPLDS